MKTFTVKFKALCLIEGKTKVFSRTVVSQRSMILDKLESELFCDIEIISIVEIL